MLARIKRSRPLRAGLALFAVPLVIFSNPETAAASGGQWHEATVTGSSQTGDTSCWLALQQDGTGSLNVSTGAYCTGSVDVTPGDSQTGEAGSSYSVIVSGTDSNGAACGNTIGGTLGQHSQNATATTAGTIGSQTIALGTTDCTVTLVCVVLEGSGSMFTESRSEACKSVNIPPEELAEQACAAGTPHAKHQWIQLSEYQWESRWTFTRYGAPLSTARWGYAAYYVNNTSDTGEWTNTSEVTTRIIGYGGTPPDPVGVELYAYTGNNWNRPPPDPAAATIGGTRPTQADRSFGGWTQPSQCRFWFGPQVVNDNTTDEDEPFGDIHTPYTPPPPPVEPPPPTITEPPEGFDWLAAIFGILGRILGAIAGLAGAIANAIIGALGQLVEMVMDGLVALFVPGDGFFEDKADQAAEAFEGTTLDNYLAVVEGLVPSGSSGCQGPAVNFSSFGFDGGSQYPLSACGGPASTAAAATRLAISVGLGLSATFACVRILGRALGWDPGLGGGQAS